MKATLRISLASFVLVLMSNLFLASCKQTSDPGTLQPGSITGVVSLWDSAEPLGSSAGVTITLDNSSYTTLSDSTGHWTIANVAPGNYNVTVSKAGFGLCRAFGVTVEGPG